MSNNETQQENLSCSSPSATPQGNVGGHWEVPTASLDELVRSGDVTLDDDLVGRAYGRLTVVALMKQKKGYCLVCLCLCACGNRKLVTRNQLLRTDGKGTRSCGCSTHHPEPSIRPGMRFGMLAVARSTRRAGRVAHLCSCDCGGEAIYLTQDLTSGEKIDCGHPRPELDDPWIGNWHGDIRVIERHYGMGVVAYRCRCRCGNDMLPISRSNLIKRKNLNCGRCKEQVRAAAPVKYSTLEDAGTAQVFQHIKGSAKRRGIGFELTFSELRGLITQNCWYSGAQPSSAVFVKRFNAYFYYQGLDRRDNTKPYRVDNVIPSERRWNLMREHVQRIARRTITPEEFKTMLPGAIASGDLRPVTSDTNFNDEVHLSLGHQHGGSPG